MVVECLLEIHEAELKSELTLSIKMAPFSSTSLANGESGEQSLAIMESGYTDTVSNVVWNIFPPTLNFNH